MIGKGECEVFVKDANKKRKFAKTLEIGDYFGEVGLLTQLNRTATVEAKSYTTLGSIKSDAFYHILEQFPRLIDQFKEGFKSYKDRLKAFLTKEIQHVEYFKGIEEGME